MPPAIDNSLVFQYLVEFYKKPFMISALNAQHGKKNFLEMENQVRKQHEGRIEKLRTLGLSAAEGW